MQSGCWCLKTGFVSEHKVTGSTAQDGRVITTYDITHKGNGETHSNEVRWYAGSYRLYDSVGDREEGRYTYASQV